MGKSDLELAMRDPALAAIMGIDDFGIESEFGNEFGAEFGDEFGGYQFGADPTSLRSSLGAGSSGLAALASPSIRSMSLPQAQVAAVLQAHAETEQKTKGRMNMLRPNAGSKVQVERYAFAINAALVLGTASAIDASNSPDVTIRPQRVTMNAPATGFVTISELKVANVSVSVGGTQDAADYAPNAVGSTLDMPTLSPANKARLLGNYTGFVPPGFAGAAAYTFCCSLKGPAVVAG